MDNFIAHILVVDDDDGIRTLVKKYLNENNFLVTTASNAEDASEKIKIVNFDLIILDIMMPGKSGLDFLKQNKKKLQTPIILLTAKGEPDERIEGLEIGADDYLPKPFEPKELILRIKNIIEKTKSHDQLRIVDFKNIKIDLNKQLILRNKKEFKINTTEKKILEKMISNPGKTFSREDIGLIIDLNKERSIDVIITRLRKKIEIDPKNPKGSPINCDASNSNRPVFSPLPSVDQLHDRTIQRFPASNTNSRRARWASTESIRNAHVASRYPICCASAAKFKRERSAR